MIFTTTINVVVTSSHLLLPMGKILEESAGCRSFDKPWVDIVLRCVAAIRSENPENPSKDKLENMRQGSECPMAVFFNNAMSVSE